MPNLIAEWTRLVGEQGSDYVLPHDLVPTWREVPSPAEMQCILPCHLLPGAYVQVRSGTDIVPWVPGDAGSPTHRVIEGRDDERRDYHIYRCAELSPGAVRLITDARWDVGTDRAALHERTMVQMVRDHNQRAQDRLRPKVVEEFTPDEWRA